MKKRIGRPKSTGLLTEQEMMRALTSGHLAFPPFSLRVQWLSGPADPGFDGIVHVRWDAHDLEVPFAFEVKSKWTSLALQQRAQRARTHPSSMPLLRPMVILPYLSDEHLARLQEHDLSGLDLCGNGLLLDPPRLFVLRTGAKSRFPTTNATPSIYQSHNVSSLIPRIFLLVPHFLGIHAVLDACRERIMQSSAEPPLLSLPTVSRTVSRLEQDLAISRKGRVLKLEDPDRILTGLERSYQAPVVTSSWFGKTTLSATASWLALRQQQDLRVVTTGRGSAAHYTGLAGPDRLQLYVSDVRRAQDVLGARETAAFPNVELLETTAPVVYFDARESASALLASPLQCYLELSQASSRERDVATTFRTRLLQTATRIPT